jgi:cysteine desulfurase
MSGAPIYLDHNATTPIAPEVLEAMLPWLRDHHGNPSSGHAFGVRARGALERARSEVAAAIGAAADEIVFTSGGTESNNLAIRGACEALEAAGDARRAIVTSAIEHPAVARPCAWLAKRGWRVTELGVDAAGRVVGDVAEGAALITVMHANNETGVVQPIAALAAKKGRALVHTDAAQSLGKIAVDVNALGVDLLTIAGHKLYAPKGVGALYVRRGTRIAPLLLGAGHERGLRPGTENVASIVGLGAACTLVTQEARNVEALRDRLWDELALRVPGLARNGAGETLPNTLSVRFPGAAGSAVLARAPEVAASTGSACHDGHESASAVLLAMGIPADEALGTVRLSLGRGTTADEIARAAEALGRAWRSLGAVATSPT